MKSNRFSKFFAISITFLAALFIVVKFAGPSFLRLYVESGIGTCQKIPILCMAPEKEISGGINREYLQELLPYRFPQIEIYLPKGFTVVQQNIRKAYYAREAYHGQAAVIYLLYRGRDFFITLFPQVKKYGITDDYEFVKHTMSALLKEIKGVSDVFFLIMKSIFTPDLGDQNNVKMVEFKIGDKRGFINYNVTGADYYFDCNVIDASAGFFKIYIKDKGGRLNLEKVLTLISTANKLN